MVRTVWIILQLATPKIMLIMQSYISNASKFLKICILHSCVGVFIFAQNYKFYLLFCIGVKLGLRTVCWEEYFDLNKGEITGDWRKLQREELRILDHSSNIFTVDELGCACGTHEDKKYMKHFNRKTSKKHTFWKHRHRWEDPVKVRVWTELISLRIETGGELL
jgi:hypothetical protein